jgi:hypothetical protein
LTRSDTVKAYLITTGALFGLIAAAHLLRTFAEWSRLGTDPWFYLEGPGLGLVAATLSLWAWRLLRASARP